MSRGRKHNPRTFLFFCIAGGSAAVVYMLILSSIPLDAHLPVWLVTGLALFVSKNVNFLINRKLTFSKVRKHSWFKQYLRFWGSTSFGSSINYFTTLGLIHYIEFFSKVPALAGALGVGCGLIFNYFANFYWVFQGPEEQISQD